ncbi:hypothetical protein F3J44_00800 [Pantoea sp. Tr-811]|uniref:hypothetical protein n=1 Tax=unclassified Pantoea TaxID=2630326 RepID=UPI00142086F9|nr:MULTISPECIES: hypothetical protein [unclassified Pantoea]NIE75229.1 hypothetical protein [Pantoea sp. Ap-967]NIF24909.1 hypothetical protein [Pantoea sp. Tr-811]
MNRLLMLALAAATLSGCSSLEATSAWKGRPVGELIDYFGVPRQIMVAPDQDLVVLRYIRESDYISREAAGTYTGPQGGQLVHAEYWEDVRHSGSCEINVFINRARLVEKVRANGRCAPIEMAPKGA